MDIPTATIAMNEAQCSVETQFYVSPPIHVRSHFGHVLVEIHKIVSEHEAQCSADTQFYVSPPIHVGNYF
jgi:hypothetical protein